MKKTIAALSFLLILSAWGGLHLIRTSGTSAPNSGRTVLSVYTTGQATTPQMPFWKAIADGDLDFIPEVHYWKNLDDLRGLLLAGKGDIWIGHIDGFAQAAMRGAPVRLVSVTGWKKFYILSNRPEIQNFKDIMNLAAGTIINSTPPHSPGVAVLRSLEQHGVPKLNFALYEPKQLALQAAQGKLDLLLVPEPLVTVLLNKVPSLRIVANVEEQYGHLTGGSALLPIAGIAVNTKTLEQYPKLAEQLTLALKKQEAPLMQDPVSGVDAMPKEFEKFIPRTLVLSSLKRDIIHVESAAKAKSIVLEYLDMIFANPNGSKDKYRLPPEFFGETS